MLLLFNYSTNSAAMVLLLQGPPQHHLAVPLLVLLSQQLDFTAITTRSNHIKLIAELYDNVHDACLQYLEFLKNALPLEEYAAMLPSLSELKTVYRVRPEIALSAWRPVLRALEYQSSAMAEEGECPEDGEAANGPTGKRSM